MPQEMSAHLQHAFAEAERQAERTGAWLRVVIALLLLGLVSPLLLHSEAIPDHHVFARIHVAVATLAGYASLAIVAFLCTTPNRYRPWMAWLFAAGDAALLAVGLLLGIGGMPGNYAMALPVVWLAPLLLVVGAMRFNPAVLLFATAAFAGVVALGLSRGADWTLFGTSPPAEIAPLFGIPPNIIRLAMLLLTGGVLTYAVLRNRRLVRQAIADARRTANLTRYLPPEIADWLATRGDAARIGERRPVAVMFVDVRDFTAMAEHMDPAAISAFLAEFRARVLTDVRGHGGLVDKFIGDAVMAVFGATPAVPVDARRALSCAQAVLDAIARWNSERQGAGLPPVAVSIGLHLGDAYVGAVGDEHRLEFTVLGDAVNVAARLQQLCRTAGAALLASDTVVQAAGGAPESWRRLPEQPIRGRNQRIAVWGLDQERAQANPAS